jgi:hypothetical protein
MAFPDIAAFSRQHTACGGLVPSVHSERDGGYALTITCRCGVVLNRWVTADEARQISPPGAPPPAPRRPPLPASPDLLAALDAAEPKFTAPPPAPVGTVDLRSGAPVKWPAPTSPRPGDTRATQAPTGRNAVIREARAVQEASSIAVDRKPRRKALIIAVVALVCLGLGGAVTLWLAPGMLERATPPARSSR